MTKTIKKSLALILSILMLMSVVPTGLSFAEETLVCGEFEYILSENEATITKYTGSDTEVEIPETLDGHTVVRIGADEASRLMPFHSNATITSVTIPDSVKCIGYGAFYKCTALENVILGDGVEVIEAGAFRSCAKLASVVLTDNITTIGLNAFKDCAELAVITIGENVESIGTEAFLGCDKLATVNFKGTISQWNEVLDGVTEGNDNLINADIVYYYGKNCQHENADVVNTVTCTDVGIKTTTCRDCGNVSTEEVPATGHKKVVGVEGVEPTCTKDGKTAAYKCETCGVNMTPSRPIKALGHDYVLNTEKSTAPTCAKAGENHYICSRCNSFKSEKVAALPHTLGDWTETKAATCTENGLKSAVCSVCDTEIKEVINAYGHDNQTVAGYAATCEKDGRKDFIFCKVCGFVEQYSDIIPALNHDYVKDESKSEDSTCEDAGKYFGVCSRCGDIKNESINPLGHVVKNEDGLDATCLKEGYKAYEYCTREGCGYTTYAEIPAPGHTEGADATCTTAQICTVCEAELVAALGHDVKIAEGYDADCTRNGLTNGEYCDRCKLVLKEQYTILSPGHTKEKLNGTPATCTEDGLKDGWKCSVCNEVLMEQAVIPATGHKEVVIEAVDPTCTTIGNTAGLACENCKTIFDMPQDIPELGHNIIDVKGYEATCTEAGLTDGKKCNRIGCDFVEVAQTEIPVKDHTPVLIPAVAPTCTEAGYTAGSKCADCGLVIAEPQEDPATGHTSGPAATCTEPRVCTVCDTVLIEALGHTPGAAATCTAPQTCTVCAEVITPVLDHELEFDMTVTKPATCFSEGYEKAHCKNCDYGYGKKLPAFGHNVQSWTTIIIPTCKGEGKAVGLCLNCKYNIEKALDAVDHKDDDNNKKCDFCSTSLGGIIIPGVDKEEDKDDDGKCSCNCHAIGIRGLIFDFILFLQRLFGLNRTCKCGEAHY